MDFCTCNSLMVNGVCSNKKCGRTQFDIDLNNAFNILNETNLDYKDLKKFDQALMVGDASLMKSEKRKDNFIAIEETTVFDLIAMGMNLDLSEIVTFNDNDDELAYAHYKKVGIKEVKGKVKRVYPVMVDFEFLSLKDCRKKGYTNKFYLGYVGNYKWKVISNNIEEDKQFDEYISRKVNVAVEMTRTLYELWNVYIKRNDSPIGFNILVDREIIKEIFKAREIKDGYQRRTALRHLVSNHTRHLGANRDTLVEIQKYMRGDLNFAYDNYSCTIIPSQADLKELELLKGNTNEKGN